MRRACLLLALFSVLSGCGLKGPLYFPEQKLPEQELPEEQQPPEQKLPKSE